MLMFTFWVSAGLLIDGIARAVAATAPLGGDIDGGAGIAIAGGLAAGATGIAGGRGTIGGGLAALGGAAAGALPAPTVTMLRNAANFAGPIPLTFARSSTDAKGRAAMMALDVAGPTPGSA